MTSAEPIRFDPPEGRSRKWRVVCGSFSDLFDPRDHAHVRRIARLLELELPAVQDELARVQAEWARVKDARSAVSQTSIETHPPVTVRAWGEPGGPAAGASETVHPDLDDALLRAQGDLFAWDGTDGLAALDFDVRGGEGFNDAEVGLLVDEQPAPLPYVGWRTKSGGVRLIFRALGSLTARARACLYLLLTDLARDPRVIRVELLHRSRRPPGGSRVIYAQTHSGVSDLRGRILALGGESACTMEEIQRWLEERGLGYGRHHHRHCPIAPSEGEHRDPVHVGEEGVYCHLCSGNLGRGWRSWAALIGKVDTIDQDPLATLATGWVHWAHAKWILRASYSAVPDGLLKSGYDALLQVCHPDEPDLRARVFDPSLAFVRGETCWLRDSDWKPHDSIGPGSLRMLPWVNGSPARVDFAMGTGDLKGYVPIVPISHLIVRPEWHHPVVYVPRQVRSCSDGPPLTWEEIRAEVREVMFGAPEEWLTVVLALVVGSIRAQRAGAMPPISILYGPSGSGKGAAVAAAEGILGAGRCGINLSARDAQDVASSIGVGLEAGAPILFGDELGKMRDFWSKSAPLLSLCDTHSWRKLYSGQVTSPVRSHVVLACSTLPRGITTMPEFDRRVAVFALPSTEAELYRAWETRVDAAWGVASLSRLRESPRGSRLAEGMILCARAHVPDEALLPWGVQARQFGSSSLADDDESRLQTDLVRQLYALWTEFAPSTILAGPEDRMPGWLRGYRIHADAKDLGDSVARVLESWIDPEDSPEERIAKVNRLETVDCRAALRLHADIRLRARIRSRRIWVRFQHGTHASSDRFNTDLFPRLPATPVPPPGSP